MSLRMLSRNSEKLDAEEWIVRLVQGMYANGQNSVWFSEGYSQEFEVKGGVLQDSKLSPLLFIVMLKALPHEFPERTSM